VNALQERLLRAADQAGGSRLAGMVINRCQC
jgi:hypothetical protein